MIIVIVSIIVLTIDISIVSIRLLYVIDTARVPAQALQVRIQQREAIKLRVI